MALSHNPLATRFPNLLVTPGSLKVHCDAHAAVSAHLAHMANWAFHSLAGKRAAVIRRQLGLIPKP